MIRKFYFFIVIENFDSDSLIGGIRRGKYRLIGIGVINIERRITLDC